MMEADEQEKEENQLMRLVLWEKIKKWGKSLQFRFFIIILLAGVVPIMLMKHGILKDYVEQSVIQRESLVKEQCTFIANQLLAYHYLDGQTSDVIELELTQLANLYNGRIVIVDGDLQVLRDTYSLDETKTIVSEAVLKSFRGEEQTVVDRDNEFIEMTIPISKNNQVQGVMIVSTPTNDIYSGSQQLSHQVWMLQVGLSIIIALVAFCASRALVKPFKKITRSLEEVKGGFVEEEMHILDYTETEQLSDAYNQMVMRMKALDDSRQEFVSNVSHELKTPITSMKVLADSLLVQEDAPKELYQEFMADIAEEIDRENKIINDLLSLVKMDRKASDVNIQETNINELLELIVKRLTPIAAKRNIELVLETYRPVNAEVDETKLTLAISNLVENAIKYNKEDGWVRLSINADHKYFYVKVEDSGLGIPEEDQEHIFERFYRVDKSHSREIGGTGLGLAITRNAILMHRGAIKVYSVEGQGTTFTVRIPLTYSV